MERSQDPVEDILYQLKNKVLVKQKTFDNLKQTFKGLEEECVKLIQALSQSIENEKLVVAHQPISENEFHIQVGGDMVVFLMHTNIITLDKAHGILQSDYVKQEESRKFFGQILIYNFMSDSLKYKRMNDPGYLLARIFLNVDNFFFAEGEGQFSFLFNNISSQPINKVDFSVLSKIAIDLAIKTDLTAPNFPEIKNITLLAKENHTQLLGGGKKIGFKMSHNEDIKS